LSESIAAFPYLRLLVASNRCTTSSCSGGRPLGLDSAQ
jgi:hypothetical protein